MRKYSGIVFDFNGTLILDDRKHVEAWKRYLRELGVKITEEEYFEHMHGSTNSAIYEYLFGEPISLEKRVTFSEGKEKYYRILFKEDPPEFAEGVRELVSFLKRHEIPHAIATSSEKNNVKFFDGIYDLTHWFGGPIIYDDGTIRGKPAPDLYLKAGRALGLPMNRLVTVEDSCSGVQACRASGAGLVVGVCPRGADKFVGSQYADRVITDFTELDYKHMFEY